MRSASRNVDVGLISDTHGLLRPEALAALAGCSRIVHAGDIGDPAILGALEEIAPVIAVRGNNDRDAWARKIPERQTVEVGRTRIHVIHDLAELDLGKEKAPVHVVVSGHSHRPRAETREGVLYVNPGSAGPRRFKLPVTVARLALPSRRVSFETLYSFASSR